MLLSVSTAFAVSDDGDVISGVDNEITIEESVLAVSDDASALEIDDDVDDESDDVSVPNVVTNDTFFNYFDESGSLLDNVTTDELEFDGDFSSLDLGYINIDRSIKFTGKNASFENVTFLVTADDVTIDGFTLTQSNDVTLITVYQSENVILSNNILNYNALDGFDGYAIFASEVNNLKLLNNTITYVGNTNGTVVNNAVRIEGVSDEDDYGDVEAFPSTNIVMDGNIFDIAIPSVDVGYDEMWNAKPYAEGIVFFACDNVTFTNNKVDVKYNNASGSSDTIYAVSVRSDAYTYTFDDDDELVYPMVSRNVVIDNNEFNVAGHKFIYALAVSAEGFEISNNIFNVSSDDYYANAITVDGPSSAGFVENNEITVEAQSAAYGIYSYQWMGAIEDMVYYNNTIDVAAYAACAMEIIECNPVITENTIVINGNHTTAIALNARDYAVVALNEIAVLGSNMGNASTGDALIHMESAGVSAKGDVIIRANNIYSTAIGVNLLQAGDIIVEDNSIVVVAEGATNNYALCVDEIDSLNVTGNNITFVGLTNGTFISNGVLISGTENAVIKENKFELCLVSSYVPWLEIPASSGNWVSFPVSEGIVIEESDNAVFQNNTVEVTYGDIVGIYDTIYAVSVKDSDNVMICDNEIAALGYTYIYGVQVSGDNFTICGNNITVKSDIYYANGINVEGPATGAVEDNAIFVSAPVSAYGIYSGMNGQNVSAVYTDNAIIANAYNVFGMSLGDVESIIVHNAIKLGGNYTTGIAFRGDNLTAENNGILANGSNVGNESVWEGFGVETVAVKVIKGNANLQNNTVISTAKGVSLTEDAIAVLYENRIAVNASEDADAYAIYATGVPSLYVINNSVSYIGATQGSGFNNAVLIYDIPGAVITGNEFYLALVSSFVPWFEIPAGSENWVSFPVSEGILIEESDNIVFAENMVFVRYIDVIGDYDTIYVVDVNDCDNAVIYANNITAFGHTYIYAIQITGDEFVIVNNTIKSESDNYYANGIDIEGPATGLVYNNNISVIGVESAYAIYSGMNGHNVSATYMANSIVGEAYNVFGMSLGDVVSNIIGNEIVLNGNYTTGIAFKGSNLTVEENLILVNGSNVGNESVWEGFGVETVAVKVVDGIAYIEDNSIASTAKGISISNNRTMVHENSVLVENNTGDAIGILVKSGQAIIFHNSIESATDYAVDVTDTESFVVENIIAAKNATGDNAVLSTENATVKSNGVLWTVMSSSDVTMVYGDDKVYSVTLTYENGTAIVNRTVEFKIDEDVQKAQTDANGVASIDLSKVDVGNHTVTAMFCDDDNILVGTHAINDIIVFDVVVTNDTFFNYFDETGLLFDFVTVDELQFAGEFSGLNLTQIIIDRSIKFTGKNASFDGVSFAVSADDVTIDGFELTQTEEAFLINVGNANNVVISNNILNYCAIEDYDSHAILASIVNNLKLLNNTIIYVGNTQGITENNAVRIIGVSLEDDWEVVSFPSTNIVIDNNEFDISIPSVDVGYDEMWNAKPYAEGIVFFACDNVTFTNNKVDVKYNDVNGSSDTIYAVSVRSDAYTYTFDDDDELVYPMMSRNVVIDNNEFNVAGHKFTYALAVSAEGFEISNNIFNVSSDDYYANAITVDGPSSAGFVENNEITVEAQSAAYGIYAYQWMGAIEDMLYYNNTIDVAAYAVCAMELVECNPTVTENTITVNGNHTTAIALNARDLGVVALNDIVVLGSNVGNASTGDSLIHMESAAVSAKGDVIIRANNIYSTAIGVNLLQAGDIIVEDNVIVVEATEGTDNYALCVDGIDSLNVIGNDITFFGATDETVISNAVLISGTDNAVIEDNEFDLSLVSSHVPWFEIPASSGNWVSVPVSEGIVIEESDNVTFKDNIVDVSYNSISGSYDTIYAVCFKDSDNAVIYGNNITALGHTYIYGIQVTGDNFNISENNITVVSDIYYANGIDIEGPATGVVGDNSIFVSAPVSVYGIYSGMNGQNVSALYFGNEIIGEAYNVFGFSSADVDSGIIGNELTLTGNYTTGIAFKGENLTVAGNEIILMSSEEGNESVWESFGVESVAIKVIGGDVSIEDNYILAQGKGVSLTGTSAAELSGNIINVAANGIDDSYGIFASSVDDLKLINNTIAYVGNTDGTIVNNVVRVEGDDSKASSNIVVDGNEFIISMPATTAQYDENWNSIFYSDAIVFTNCDNVSFVNNKVNLEYNDYYGIYDSINVLVFGNANFEFDDDYEIIYPNVCKNVVVNNNVVNAKGHNFIYGISIAADESTISNNVLNISSDYHYADGIQVSGPSSGIDVESNVINLSAPDVAYGIYSYQYMGEIDDMIYFNNTIEATAYAVCAMEIVENNPLILDNTILINGNHTTGIALNAIENAIVELNDITVLGSNVGNASTGDSLIHMESAGVSAKGDVVIRANNIYSTAIGVNLLQAGDIAVEDNIIIVEAEGATDNYALCVDEIDSLNVTGNDITFVGLTDGTVISNGVLISGTDNSVIKDNEFDLSLVSSYVPWFEIPAGSGNWVSFPVSEGIVIEESDNVVFDENTVNVDYDDVVGSYDTIYAVCFKDSDNAVIYGNNITALGHTYIYGVQVSGDNFTIAANNITVESDIYYANGIDIEGPAAGVVEDNVIVVNAPVSVYGIYSGMNGQNVSAVYSGNEIVGEAYSAFGMSLGDVESIIVDNDILLNGNYTTGIAFKGDNLTVEDNLIFVNGTNVGNESVWESFGVETVGIKTIKGIAKVSNNDILATAKGLSLSNDETEVSENTINVVNNTNGATGILVNSGKAIISHNEINTTTDSAINLTDTNSVVSENSVVAKNATGNKAIDSTGNATIKGNGVIKTIISGSDVSLVYSEDKKYTVSLTYENGTAAAGKTIEFTVNGVVKTAITDADGVASISLSDVTKGTHVIVAECVGDDETVGSTTNNTITVTPKATKLVYSDIAVLLTAVKAGAYYQFTLTDVDGKALADKEVMVTFNGATTPVITDANGVANYQLAATKEGSYQLTMTFADDSGYIGTSGVATIKLNKEKTKLKVSKTKFKAKTKTKKVKVTLKDSKNKAIKGVKVTIKVKGKTYKAKTNKKGVATVKITKLNKKGTYKAKVKFAGNTYYKLATKTVKIKVKK